jgi:hypothetical protein
MAFKRNHLSSTIPDLSNLTTLRLLFLSAEFPSSVPTLSWLYHLDLLYNSYSIGLVLPFHEFSSCTKRTLTIFCCCCVFFFFRTFLQISRAVVAAAHGNMSAYFSLKFLFVIFVWTFLCICFVLLPSLQQHHYCNLFDLYHKIYIEIMSNLYMFKFSNLVNIYC